MFALSVRREYAHRAAGTKPKCRTCRRPELPMTAAEREKYRAWWLEHFTLAEIRELAEGIWGRAVSRETP